MAYIGRKSCASQTIKQLNITNRRMSVVVVIVDNIFHTQNVIDLLIHTVSFALNELPGEAHLEDKIIILFAPPLPWALS